MQFSYDDRSVVVVNDRHRAASGHQVIATVLDANLKTRFGKEAVVEVPADGVVRAFTVPELTDLGGLYFLKLTLEDSAGKEVDSNFYWLSTRPDVMQWEKNDWFHVPVTSHADLTALATLPAPRLAVSARAQAPPAGEGRTAVVRVANTGKTLAFQVRLKMSAGAKELLPVLWEDNYFTLLPGESREVDVSYPAGAGTATVEALAWNGAAVTAAVTR